ncbi:MAG: hypothetical protein N3B16_00860 [Candidatus Aminicenantes bacterium]|nr:hypothetical protein [Candidatus Aminicenantes bacterium]
MRLRTKIAIIMIALVLSLVGFNLIVTPSALELAKIGKQAGAEIIANYLMKVEATSKTPAIKG